MVSNRNVVINISGFIFLFLVSRPVIFGASQKDPLPIKAVINYSVAPWDGSAYEILIPLKDVPNSSNPFIRINIWGNPEFQKSEVFRFSGKDSSGDSKESGRAAFQSVLNKSWPETLAGTVSFKTLEKGQPVFGTFDFVTADGRTFRGMFQAIWGNKPLSSIR